MRTANWITGIVVVLAAGVAAAVWLSPRRSVAEVATLACDDHLARDLAFAPDGRRLVGAGEGGIATAWAVPGFGQAWSADCGAKLRTIVVLGATGRVAAACDDAELHLLDADTGAEVRKAKLPAKVLRLAAAPDGRTLAAGTADGRILVWDSPADGEPRSWRTGGKHVHGLAFSADSRTLVSGDDKGSLQAWDAATGKPLNSASLGRQHIHDVQIAGDRIAVAMAGKGVLVGKVADLQLEPLPGDSGMALAVALSPDGDRIATGHEDGAVRLWRLDGTAPKAMGTMKKAAVAVRFSPDGGLLAAAGGDGKVHVWPATGR